MSSIGFGQFRVVFDNYQLTVNANTDILTSALLGNPQLAYAVPKNTPISLFILYCSFQIAGNVLVVRVKNNGIGPILTEILNTSTMNANTMYTFVFPVSPDEQINLRYSADTTATKITLLELMERP